MKKQMKPIVLIILLFVHMSGTVYASFVGSAAELDLELVSFTPLSGDATLELKNESNQVFVGSGVENAEASGSTDAFATLRNSGGIADAGSSSEELFASTEINAEGDTVASAEHSVDYMAQGSGVVQVTVDYSFLIESNDVSNQDSELFASASLFDNATEVFDEASLSVSEGDDLSLDIPGELEILLIVDDGDIGTLVFNTSSSADLSALGVNEVPLPPALVLFASALIGLTAVKRRQIS